MANKKKKNKNNTMNLVGAIAIGLAVAGVTSYLISKSKANERKENSKDKKE